ncbi:MAG: hypothetical protein DLM70_02360, partial [Chloroflexi bacterium]
MAIEMRTEVRGMTREQAQGFASQVLPKIKTFPGFIAHASGPSESGYYVTEFWESQQAHEKWVQEVIMPAMQQAGA